MCLEANTPSEVDPRELTEHVLPALGGDASGPWELRLLARPKIPGLATVGIWRVGGAGWSAVVKLLRYAREGHPQWQVDSAPDHPYYWRREAEAVTSNPLRGLETGIRPPRCYAVVDRSDGSTAVWMEDAGTRSASEWSLRRYADFARRLGRAQGTLVNSARREQGWPSRNYLRTYLDRRAATATAEADALWERRLRRLRRLEATPHTLCHLDLHPDNIFEDSDSGADGEGEILIDWAFAGFGAIGEDIGTLAVDTVSDFHLAPELIEELFERLVAAYAEGLGDAGRTYDEALVRDACALGALTKYAWFPTALRVVERERRETINGRPTEEARPSWQAVVRFLHDLDRQH